jgi:drug/metabolite transporter (DMT)-like permease
MTYGLLAALGWGVSTLAAAVAARQIGSFLTVVVGEATALAGYALVFVLGHFTLRGAGGAAWLLLPAGVIGVVGYLALYRGLESGHVGLVSAISACYAAVTVVLSVLLLGEHFSALAALGIAATLAGVVLAVARGAAPGPEHIPAPDPIAGLAPGPVPAVSPQPCATGTPGPATTPRPESAPRLRTVPATGAIFGIIAALCYGVGGFLIGRYTRELGWLVPVVVARVAAMGVLLALLATPLRRGASVRLTQGLAWAAAAGLTDAAGLTFFARGGQVGLVSITAAVSSAYPVIPLIGGLLLFRERLLRRQAGGAALILAGLVLVGMGS